MAWSDAARKAALEVRRLRTKGRLYHGGVAGVKGRHLKPFGKYGSVFSGESIKAAKSYATDAALRQAGKYPVSQRSIAQSVKRRGGAIYEVQRSTAMKFVPGLGAMESSRPVHILRRLPSLLGKTSRPRFFKG